MKHPGLRSAARHEAAHAVVAARLGLPLVSVDVRVRSIPANDPASGSIEAGTSLGLTVLEPPCEGYELKPGEQLTPAQKEEIEARAAQAAAGIVAEGSIDEIGARTDLYCVCHQWGVIDGRVGETLSLSFEENKLAVTRLPPSLAVFIEGASRRAAQLLQRDGGVAWDRVKMALVRKSALTGDEVRTIVKDAEVRDTP